MQTAISREGLLEYTSCFTIKSLKIAIVVVWEIQEPFNVHDALLAFYDNNQQLLVSQVKNDDFMEIDNKCCPITLKSHDQNEHGDQAL